MYLFALLIPATMMVSCGNAVNHHNATEGTLQEAPVIQHIKQDVALPMLKDTNVITIDVRTQPEISRGYIDGADLFIDVNGDFKAEIAKLDKTKTYLVYCHSGARSNNAVNQMKAAGFTNLYNLVGGISSWSGPVTK